MSDIFIVVTLGFLLGVRHATDADHVVAVTTIVTRQRETFAAAITGLMWGLGHTLTLVIVGALIIVFNLAIPFRVGVGMELSVGVMLIVLGVINVAAFLRARERTRRRDGPQVHAHPLASLDRRLGRFDLYAHVRPVVVGVVHGLAGSAAVTLLVVAAVPDPRWAIVYMLVFGLGTMAGMMLITIGIASAFRLASGRSELVSRRFGLVCGIASVVFGVSFAYQIWSAAETLVPGH